MILIEIYWLSTKYDKLINIRLILIFIIKESKILFDIYRKIAFMLPPEAAHDYTLKLAELVYKSYLGDLIKDVPKKDPINKVNIKFENKLGLAAGFDKNGDYLNFICNIGFGYVEIGTATPRPQLGNKKPRVFRITSQDAVINHLGFNNKGIIHLKKNLVNFTDKKTIPIGVNIGKNATTPIDKAHEDYIYCMEQIYELADYLTINISSPNTKDLRSLHGEERLLSFLEKIKRVHEKLEQKYKKLTPLFLKISPDLEPDNIISLCNMIEKFSIHGTIATNTTIDMNIIKDKNQRVSQGGVSGKPLFEKSNRIICRLKKQLPNHLIIGCGGVSSKKSAQEKIDSGCDLLQLYTGLIYRGTKIINEITS